MEDIREVALTYYANSSDEIKKVAKDFFKSMDTDGNGVITFYEFKKFVKKNWGEFKPELFAELDKNGDGCLDYEEVIVFYYMSKMRFCFCAGCGQHLKNMYFTCVQCFENKSSNQTYDLCFTCYKTKHFTHEHSVFLDNYAMLNFMRPNDSKEKNQVAEPDDKIVKTIKANRGIDRGRGDDELDAYFEAGYMGFMAGFLLCNIM